MPLTKTFVRYFQAANGLAVDGIAGPKTIAKLTEWDRNYRVTQAAPTQDVVRLAIGTSLRWPAIPWTYTDPDSEHKTHTLYPVITSDHYKDNPDRPTHYGIDIFYPYHVSMGPVAVKDGGAAGSKGKARWYLPPSTPITPVAKGTVVWAGPTPTGGLVWIKHTLVINGTDVFWYSGYFHLSMIGVKVGEEVTTFRCIGFPGDNPKDNDAIHLHLEGYYDQEGVPPYVKYKREATFSLTHHLLKQV